MILNILLNKNIYYLNIYTKKKNFKSYNLGHLMKKVAPTMC